jgi:hypothetical protein
MTGGAYLPGPVYDNYIRTMVCPAYVLEVFVPGQQVPGKSVGQRGWWRNGRWQAVAGLTPEMASALATKGHEWEGPDPDGKHTRRIRVRKVRRTEVIAWRQ